MQLPERKAPLTRQLIVALLSQLLRPIAAGMMVLQNILYPLVSVPR